MGIPSMYLAFLRQEVWLGLPCLVIFYLSVNNPGAGLPQGPPVWPYLKNTEDRSLLFSFSKLKSKTQNNIYVSTWWGAV